MATFLVQRTLFAEDGPSDCTLLFVSHTLSPKVLYLLINIFSIGTNIIYGTLVRSQQASQMNLHALMNKGCLATVAYLKIGVSIQYQI